MEIGIVQGEAKPLAYEPLDPSWKESEFNTLTAATEFAMQHGWAAKPQVLQLRRVASDSFIVERYDGCGCGG